MHQPQIIICRDYIEQGHQTATWGTKVWRIWDAAAPPEIAARRSMIIPENCGLTTLQPALYSFGIPMTAQVFAAIEDLQNAALGTRRDLTEFIRF